MSAKGQTLRDEKVARMIDREIAPVWHDRFAELIWRQLPRLGAGVALDVHAGSGRGTEELIERLGPGVRVLALEPNPALRNLAKSRMQPEWKQRVYYKDGDIGDVADMPDDAYDIVVANLVLGEAHDLGEAIAGLMRVTKPGGSLLATFPLAGSWSEAEDLLQEVLRDGNLPDAMHRLRRLANMRPRGVDLTALLGELGIANDQVVLDQERFTLLFRSGREFLFSPLVERGPLRLWKAVIAKEGNPQEVFFRFKEAIDTYYADHVFSVTALAGLLHITMPGAGDPSAAARTYWARFPTMDQLFRQQESTATVVEEVHIEIDVDEAEVPAVESEPVVRPMLTAEDEALFALLGQSPAIEPQPNAELDALLDQVLEFDSRPSEKIETLADADFQEVEPDPPRRGETLKRIKALLPPPPSTPPPPPKKRS